ncbi:hypothetical protein [Gordonia sp. HS-NH1]|uniref:hypothetical protein n=1 Tax=Gordonia sp. HS-NH1 TaxID=1435068 RepID=UPI0006E38497|nr:hypothetical protein [Gordonia sp. HS-NH1]
MTALILVSLGGVALGAMLRISGVVTAVPTVSEVLGAVPANPTSSQARALAVQTRGAVPDDPEVPDHRVT